MGMMATSWIYSLLSSMSATRHRWLLSTGNVASRTEELNLKFYFALINVNLNSHVGFVAAVLDSTALERRDMSYCLQGCHIQFYHPGIHRKPPNLHQLVPGIRHDKDSLAASTRQEPTTPHCPPNLSQRPPGNNDAERSPW